jgi:hypothetical protein
MTMAVMYGGNPNTVTQFPVALGTPRDEGAGPTTKVPTSGPFELELRRRIPMSVRGVAAGIGEMFTSSKGVNCLRLGVASVSSIMPAEQVAAL